MEDKKKKMRILFVSANPTSTRKLDLNDELRTFQNSMRGHDVQVTLLPAAQPDDLRITLESEDFDVVHFCGHAKEAGILMRNPRGVEELVSGAKIAELLSQGKTRLVDGKTVPAKGGTKLAFLNACNTETVANEIKETVDMAIGTKEKVNDKVAKVMSEVFYSGIAKGYSLDEAYKEASNEIDERDKKNRGLNVYLNVTSEADAELPQGKRPRDQVLLPGKRISGQGVQINGQPSWDKHFHVSHLRKQIDALHDEIRLNQDLLGVLVGVGVVALPILLWVASPIKMMEFFPFTVETRTALIGEKPLLEWISTMGASIPILVASFKSRFLINGNEKLRLLKQLLETVKSSDKMSPELQRRLHTIMEQSVRGAES